MSKLRIAIWGCGAFAGAHARRLKTNPDVEIAALLDIDEGQIASLVERRLAELDPTPPFYTDAAQMFAEAHLDGVVIVTPHTLHFEHAMQALDAGCHVLVEKPMVTQVAQARQLVKKVEATGKILIVGYNTSFTPACRYVRDAVRDGRFGRLEMITAYLCQDWKRLTQGKWRHDPALSGGGQAYDSGMHLLNTVCWCTESRVDEVFAYMDNQDAAVDINSVMTIRFENGVLASVAIGGNCPDGASHTSFLFDGGRIDVDGWGGEWVRAWKGKDEATDLPDCTQEGTPDSNFVDAILGRAEPLCTVHNGRVQSELMEAAYTSAASGRPERSPAVNHKGDTP